MVYLYIYLSIYLSMLTQLNRTHEVHHTGHSSTRGIHRILDTTTYTPGDAGILAMLRSTPSWFGAMALLPSCRDVELPSIGFGVRGGGLRPYVHLHTEAQRRISY